MHTKPDNIERMYLELKQEHSKLTESYDKLYNSYLEEQNNRIEIAKKYHAVFADNKQSLALNDQLHKHSLKLRAEIRALHRKLRDANRGAERNAWIAYDLAKKLAEYKIKHPEPYAKKIEAEFVTGTMVCGVDLAQGLDQTVTYTYDGKAHTAKIQQQQNDGA